MLDMYVGMYLNPILFYAFVRVFFQDVVLIYLANIFIFIYLRVGANSSLIAVVGVYQVCTLSVCRILCLWVFDCVSGRVYNVFIHIQTRVPVAPTFHCCLPCLFLARIHQIIYTPTHRR
jgi:hypothetical protein